jgi:hypothetical protein
MADEKYIRKLQQTLLDRISAYQEKSRKENREAEINKTEAPKAWMKLKAWLKESTKQVNQAFPTEVITYTEDGLNVVMLRCNLGTDQWDLEVSFSDALGESIVAEVKRQGSFRAEFRCEVEGRELRWFETANDRHETLGIEEMGQRILDAAVQP